MRIVAIVILILLLLIVSFLVITVCIDDYKRSRRGEIIFGTIHSVKKSFNGKYSVSLFDGDCERCYFTDDPMIRAYLGKKARYFVCRKQITKV